MDKTLHTIRHGKYTYGFKKNEKSDKYEIEVLLDGNRIHGYAINDDIRQFDFFIKTIEESFEAGQTFMSCVRITRVFEDQTIEMKDNRLIHYKGGNSHSKTLKNMDEVESAVKNELTMLRCPIKKAIRILEQVTQQNFFKEKNYPEKY
ncbi:MAG: hypothetical protein H8D87_21290 [Deltaproteobacteria bacterium]|uniref:hypothetical protein n=1 Tax=Desulfobacula sp. TaxID=2593537 RepID=UPI00198401ED|nr:hypothetical protein [Candidatus Desulfobacula maris]MBL6996065.1 hypothetical protein [Desulfobacula sp.]